MKLPVVSGTEAVKAFGKVGYEVDEQHGSHIILRRPEPHTDGFPFRTTRNLPKAPFEP
jgi:predicted RNA binding protein YcfA (HicA-like mRNA interferase family)